MTGMPLREEAFLEREIPAWRSASVMLRLNRRNNTEGDLVTARRLSPLTLLFIPAIREEGRGGQGREAELSYHALLEGELLPFTNPTTSFYEKFITLKFSPLSVISISRPTVSLCQQHPIHMARCYVALENPYVLFS